MIFGDVLEHLIDPGDVLRRAAKWLSPTGYVLASIPNIAHVSILFELVNGRFDYRSLGLLDETHLRFFTKGSIFKLFGEAGLTIESLGRVYVLPEETEFATGFAQVPQELSRVLELNDEATTYQFIVKARPEAQAAPAAIAASTSAIPSPGGVRMHLGILVQERDALRLEVEALRADRDAWQRAAEELAAKWERIQRTFVFRFYRLVIAPVRRFVGV